MNRKKKIKEILEELINNVNFAGREITYKINEIIDKINGGE